MATRRRRSILAANVSPRGIRCASSGCREGGGSGRSTVDGGEGNESTGGKAPTDGKFGFRVEFLTPDGCSDDQEGKPVPMPALGGAAAFPPRLLDYLIHQPIRVVLLHGTGVPVLVASPERYAIHKLTVPNAVPGR